MSLHAVMGSLMFLLVILFVQERDKKKKRDQDRKSDEKSWWTGIFGNTVDKSPTSRPEASIVGIPIPKENSMIVNEWIATIPHKPAIISKPKTTHNDQFISSKPSVSSATIPPMIRSVPAHYINPMAPSGLTSTYATKQTTIPLQKANLEDPFSKKSSVSPAPSTSYSLPKSRGIPLNKANLSCNCGLPDCSYTEDDDYCISRKSNFDDYESCFNINRPKERSIPLQNADLSSPYQRKKIVRQTSSKSPVDTDIENPLLSIAREEINKLLDKSSKHMTVKSAQEIADKVFQASENLPKREKREARKRASKTIYFANMFDARGNVIDLHCMLVEDAVELTESKLEMLTAISHERKTKKAKNTLTIITGYGKSKGGECTIKPAIEKWLTENDYEFTCVKQNKGKIVVTCK